MLKILVDGDILCYTQAATNEQEIDWGDGVVTHHTTEQPARDAVDATLRQYSEEFEGEVFVCLSSRRNWRKEVFPEYKANRRDKPRPILLEVLKEHCRKGYKFYEVDGLEADDVIGVMATTFPNHLIISTDKDMKTIPGARIWNPRHPEDGIDEYTPARAHFHHMLQTLMGDSSDGYPGCPGIGRVRAEAALVLALSEDIPLWTAVVRTYESKGLTREDALRSARMAKILDKSLWDRKTKTHTMWVPEETDDALCGVGTSKASREGHDKQPIGKRT